MLGLSMMILESRCLAEIHDRGPDDFFIDSYMMSENTKRVLDMLLFITVRVKKEALGTGRRSMEGFPAKGSSKGPAPRGDEGKEESSLIDLPDNPTFYAKVSIIREKSRARRACWRKPLRTCSQATPTSPSVLAS